jgi:hypothetical protein
VDSWGGASTSLNLLTSGTASVCMAATRSEGRNEQGGGGSMMKQRAGGNGVGLRTYDDEDLGDGGGGLRLVGLRRRHGQIGARFLFSLSLSLFILCEEQVTLGPSSKTA